MKIPQGYKQTELGVIPEEWEVVKLGNLSQIKTGKRNGDEQIKNGRYPFFVRSNFIARIDSYSFDGEAILVPGEGGIGNIFHYINGKFDYHQRVYKISNFADILNGKFLYYYLQQYFGIYALSLTSKATVDSLRLPTFQDFAIAIPYNIEEQRKIAEALSDVDALIATLDKKIAKKRLIKQGAMIRLLGEKGKQFRTQKIKDIVSIKKGDMLTSEQYIAGNIPVIAGGKSAAGYHNIANRSANTITISASGASAGYVAFHDYPIFATDCSTIESSKSYNIKYIYYLLTFYQSELYALQTGGAQPHVHPNDIYDLNIYYNGNIEDQRNIATILSDMDKEVADLEARRDKYKLIKSGMMQKLLTGQIRLIKPLAPIIPLAAPENKIREIPLQTHIVAGHIVNTLYQSSGWGRTKLQKTLHLVGYHCQLDFGNEYIRNTAGPDDQVMMNHIDSKFKQYRHVKIEAKKDNDKTRYNYIPTAMIDELEQVYETYPQTIRDAVDSLINKIKKMDLARAEIVSTLYAVWNNRIIKGEQISDDLLLADFYAWSKHKSVFSCDLVFRGLNYMRKENIIPVGWGKYIDKR
ncbi:restriction endonuclease subunit S [uncultured Alistipes sp.]|uniref:restriction endonuclease subunit S n=1 Tax=uncultured Alistipes sp. TaxID=538949 RepID=UPI002619E5E1|nr:restriction endonuclease subunit S [uncultured Alistipes sp.]